MSNDKNAAVISELKLNYSSHYSAINPQMMSEHFYHDSCYYFRGEVLPALPEDKAAHILEIGCAAGHLIRFLASIGYSNVGAIELDAQLCDVARRYVGESARFIECGDAMQFLSRCQGRFDMIIATDVIEHFTLEDGAALCRQALDALAPGGRLLLRTQNMANILGTYIRHSDLTHQMGYTEETLKRLALSSGFARAEIVIPKFGLLHLQTVRLAVTNLFHRLLFAMQGQPPCQRFDPSIVMCAYKK